MFRFTYTSFSEGVLHYQPLCDDAGAMVSDSDSEKDETRSYNNSKSDSNSSSKKSSFLAQIKVKPP